MEELQLIDIADDLVILNRNTLETLIHLDKADNCIALYILYYRLAKWQKTDKIKALDSYVCKTLNWGKDKLTKIKKILKEQGLIEIIQNRKNGKIDGWYIKIHYIVSKKNMDELSIKIDNIPVADLPVTDYSTSCSQDTIALRNNINCLKNKIQLLEEENNKLKSLLKESEKEKFNSDLINKFWDVYPKKKSKGNVEKWFVKNKPSEELVNEMINKIKLLKETEQWKSNNGQYIPYPASWLNAKGWEDEVSSDGIVETEEEEIARLKAEVERRKANGDW